MTTAIYFTSERELPRNGDGVWNSCRVVADLQATSLATANECILADNDRHKGLAARIAICMRGLKGADGNWRADSGFNQGDIDEIHGAMFPGLPMPTLVTTADWQAIIDHLPKLIESGPNKDEFTDGKAINIAAKLSVLPANDPARKYTDADHEFTLRGRKGSGAAMKLLRIDPMRPQRESYQGDWVDADSVRVAAKAILGGTIYAELYPIGDWTQAKLATARLRQRAAAGDIEIARLERELARCENGTEDCAEALAGQREAIADRLQEVVDEIREN